ncbi:sensor histidine kinase [Opitutus terrae]|uniref:histidine kinase n=1 Tax=Opitutus terrae (strain DSM 11246 / JCM 15787 / PB90-1) TaxID=452637 RepID=B1ZU03_OPITP|nr:PAS domain-containing protein [Opitutus terrae]ACB75885.1 PAS/PAC sensor signal transduction histidine kinase [Opitutus terrae PB90-1]
MNDADATHDLSATPPRAGASAAPATRNPQSPGVRRRAELARLIAKTLAFALAFALFVPRLPAAEETPPTITTGAEFWTLTSTAGDREYPIHAEIGVHYYDSEWNVLWAEWDGAGCYLDTGRIPLPLRSGEKFEIIGVARPGRQQIVWERTTIKPLGPFAPTPSAIPDSISAPADFNLRLVTATGLVTEQADSDATHQRLLVVGDNWSLTAHVHVDASQPIPQWRGAYVRMRGVFAAKFDTAQKQPFIEMWIVSPSHIELQSWLDDDYRFTLTRTNIEALGRVPRDQLVRIAGTVRAQEPGQSLTVRDETGQVRLFTRQPNVLPTGAEVEAIGYPDVVGVEPRLLRSVVRPRAATVNEPLSPGLRAVKARLRMTEQVRQLAPAEAARGYPAELQGVVTWIDPSGSWFFLQDATGGVRVQLPPDSSIERPKLAMGVVVTGATQSGDYAPVIAAERWTTGLGQTLPTPERVTFEQALAGTKYGEWIELRGYVRSVEEPRDGLAQVELTTPGGELVAHVPALPPDHGLVGALVDLRAVCDVVVNDRRQLVGARLWVPGQEFIEVREPAPADLFATPKQPIGSLLQIGSAGQLHRRVQVSGVVALHRPGVLLYLEEGDDHLLVLSRQRDPLQPGDRVNVVGFPGHEGMRLIMRDAVYHRTGTGPAPATHAVALTELDPPNPALDGTSVSVRGRLLDQAATPENTKLQLQRGRTLFEAAWSGPSDRPLELGSLLELTGVYRVLLDEYRQPHAIRLELQSPADVQVLERPPWWTASRVLWIVALLLGIVATALVSLALLARKNSQLHRAETALQRANSDLEARVAARTQDLRLEIGERQRSEEVLAEERKLLRTLIDNLPVYLYVKNALGKFVVSNAPHARLLGVDDGLAVVGRTDFDIYPREIAERYAEDDQRVLQTGEPLILHEEPSSINGHPCWLATTKVPLRDRRGQIVGLIGISQDITERKEVEAEREELNNQLLTISRKAGMAEVATGVLHNVGNVLNSVNVSASMAADHVRRSKAVNLARIVDLLQEHSGNLSEFLTSDARGRKIPAYLGALSGELVTEQQKIVEELELVRRNIDHIKEIVTMQQNYARISGVTEEIDLIPLVEDALRMSQNAFQRYGIAAVRDFCARPVLVSDRHRLMQVLLNLINNAKDACRDTKQAERQITIRITEDDARIRVAVIDNGVGIATENRTRIFSHGFTTKKEGHGFGLHSSALAAKELGGSLEAHSEGVGQGAMFTLELPLTIGSTAARQSTS